MIKWWTTYDDMHLDYGSLCDNEMWQSIIEFNVYTDGDYLLKEGSISYNMRTKVNDDKQLDGAPHRPHKDDDAVVCQPVHRTTKVPDSEPAEPPHSVNEDGHQPDELVPYHSKPLALDFIKVVTT